MNGQDYNVLPDVPVSALSNEQLRQLVQWPYQTDRALLIAACYNRGLKFIRASEVPA